MDIGESFDGSLLKRESVETTAPDVSPSQTDAGFSSVLMSGHSADRLRGMSEGEEMVVLPPLLHLHLPAGSPLSPGHQDGPVLPLLPGRGRPHQCRGETEAEGGGQETEAARPEP